MSFKRAMLFNDIIMANEIIELNCVYFMQGLMPTCIYICDVQHKKNIRYIITIIIRRLNNTIIILMDFKHVKCE